MIIEHQSELFVDKMIELYLINRDAKGLLAQMHSNISWLGTGEREISQGLVEAREALEKEIVEYGGSFNIIEKELYSIKISDSACVVYGFIKATPEKNLVEEQNLHITAICLKMDAEMKLMHCNISRPDCMQQENSYYVPPHERADNKTLRGTLENRERWLQNLTRNIPGGVHQCLNDPNFTLINMSDSFLNMFGFSKEEIETQFENKFINMLYPNDRAKMLKLVHEQLKDGTTIEVEYRVMVKNGEPVWILDKGRLLEDGSGNEYFYCILIDITQRKQEQEQLRLSLERHKIIMDQATDIIFEWDIAADTLSFSSNWRKKFGYDPIDDKISNKIPISENIHPDDISAFIKIMRDTAAGTPYSETEFRIRDAIGKYWWCRIRATAQFDQNGRSIKAVGVITDISAEKEERLALIEQAQNDALTGLYNKSAIKAKVEQQMRKSSKDDLQAMLIIDVDYFKHVNDTYGHLCGDTLLSDIAEILKRHFRASDLIGRIGGDEFLVYMACVTSQSIVERKVKSVLEALTKLRPVPIAAAVTCSVGAAVLPCKDIDYFDLYKAADNALYHRKNAGRNGISFYNQTLTSSLMGGKPQSAVSEFIDSEQCSTSEQALAQYIFLMLYQSSDIESAINSLLEIIGRSYGVSRVYIFENSQDGLCLNNTFEWCAPDIKPEKKKMQCIHFDEDSKSYMQNFNAEGIFYCQDIKKLNQSLRKMFSQRNVRSLAQFTIMDKGQFKGYVGFDKCFESCCWTNEQICSLGLIANTLSIFILKLRLEEQIKS